MSVPGGGQSGCRLREAEEWGKQDRGVRPVDGSSWGRDEVWGLTGTRQHGGAGAEDHTPCPTP